MIGNLVVYAVPALFGGFTWLFNAYITAGYLAWNQYLVVWGGTALQILNFVFMIAAAFSYNEITDVGARNLNDDFLFVLGWALVTGGCYTGYWLLNNNFLTYYIIENINHGFVSEEALNVVEEEQTATI